jgi:hypothetical protein
MLWLMIRTDVYSFERFASPARERFSASNCASLDVLLAIVVFAKTRETSAT